MAELASRLPLAMGIPEAQALLSMVWTALQSHGHMAPNPNHRKTPPSEV